MPADDACQPIDRCQFELFCPVTSMEEMTIKRSKAGCELEWPWKGLLFSVVKNDEFLLVGEGGVGKKLQCAAGQSNTIALSGIAHLFSTTIKRQ
jgi:hypothetical protein